MEEGNRRTIRDFVIKSMKRYMMDMDLMKNIILQNEHAFDTKEDILKQFDILKHDFKAVIDYNFYPDEIKVIEEKDLE